MNKKRVITTIDEELWLKIQEKRKETGGYTYPELIRMGYIAREDNPQLVRRVGRNEYQVQNITETLIKMKDSLEQARNILIEIKARIEEQGENSNI